MKIITKSKELLENLAVGVTGIGGMLITAAVTNDPELSATMGYASGELLARKLTKQRNNMGIVRKYVIEDMKRRRDESESFRTDGFIGNETSTDRSDFDDIVDSILLKAADELNEKKLRYIGYLTSSFAFPPEISADSAHRLIQEVENLSYRQLCLLKIASEKENYQLCDISLVERPGGEPIHQDYTYICDECIDLYDQGYIIIKTSRDVIPGARSVVVRPNSISPGTKLLWSNLYDRMKLAEIPPEDIDAIVLGFNYNWTPAQG